MTYPYWFTLKSAVNLGSTRVVFVVNDNDVSWVLSTMNDYLDASKFENDVLSDITWIETSYRPYRSGYIWIEDNEVLLLTGWGTTTTQLAFSRFNTSTDALDTLETVSVADSPVSGYWVEGDEVFCTIVTGSAFANNYPLQVYKFDKTTREFSTLLDSVALPQSLMCYDVCNWAESGKRMIAVRQYGGSTNTTRIHVYAWEDGRLSLKDSLLMNTHSAETGSVVAHRAMGDDRLLIVTGARGTDEDYAAKVLKWDATNESLSVFDSFFHSNDDLAAYTHIVSFWLPPNSDVIRVVFYVSVSGFRVRVVDYDYTEKAVEILTDEVVIKDANDFNRSVTNSWVDVDLEGSLADEERLVYISHATGISAYRFEPSVAVPILSKPVQENANIRVSWTYP